MPEFVGIFDGGTTIIKQGGRLIQWGVLFFRASVNEAKPIDFEARYPLYLRDSVIKYLKRIHFPRPEFDVSQHREKIDQAEYLEALGMASVNDFAEAVIDLPAGSMIVPGRCRICGCTDNDCSQCIEKTGNPCHWISEDLCSACLDMGQNQ